MEYILKTKHSEILDLLKKFQDRKSGKIVESRKILRDSFYFLRRKDKRLVLRAFLNGSKTDVVSGTYATPQRKMAVCADKRSGPLHHT